MFTRKVNTDVSYIACAQMLLDRRDRIYPQFATHNAHTCAAVLPWRATTRTASSSSACMAWASRCTTSSASGGHALPDLCAGRRAPRPAGLSGAAAAGERRQQLLRQPDRRRGASGPRRSRSDPVMHGAEETGRTPSRNPMITPAPELYRTPSARTPRAGTVINDPASITPLLRGARGPSPTTWTAGRCSPRSSAAAGRSDRPVVFALPMRRAWSVHVR